jgi:hypothetical protein
MVSVDFTAVLNTQRTRALHYVICSHRQAIGILLGLNGPDTKQGILMQVSFVLCSSRASNYPFTGWPDPTSCVITRGWDFAQNLSGGTETLIPERLLFGIVPTALLQVYR